jgi:hypothetical protein
VYFATDVPLPAIGTLIACVRHGYCAVAATARCAIDEPWAQRGRVRRRSAQPRSQHELREFLLLHPKVTLAVLRRHRFTLRRVAAAEQAGELSIDWDHGIVRRARRPADPEAPCAPTPREALTHPRRSDKK